MALFFFRYIGSATFEDPDGVELASVADAEREARVRASELWAEGVRLNQDRTHWRVDVLDDGNEVLARVSFTDAIDDPGI